MVMRHGSRAITIPLNTWSAARLCDAVLLNNDREHGHLSRCLSITHSNALILN